MSGPKTFFTVDVFVEKSAEINRKSIRKMSGPPLDSFNAVYFCCRRKCRRHLSAWRRSSRPFLLRFLGQMKCWVENTSSFFIPCMATYRDICLLLVGSRAMLVQLSVCSIAYPSVALLPKKSETFWIFQVGCS